MSITTPTLNEKQFNRIIKRFVANDNIRKDMAHPYLLNGNQIMATNAHTAALIDIDKLDFTYAQTAEDANTKDKMVRLVEYLFNDFNADLSLTIGKVSIQDTIRFLKSIKNKDKEHLLAETYKTEIKFNQDRTLSFTFNYYTEGLEYKESTHVIECKDIQVAPYSVKEFSAVVSTDYLINTLMTLKETDRQSTLNFTDDPMKPILFDNSTLQIIIAPIKSN